MFENSKSQPCETKGFGGVGLFFFWGGGRIGNTRLQAELSVETQDVSNPASLDPMEGCTQPPLLILGVTLSSD